MTRQIPAAPPPRLPADYWRLWWAAAADGIGDGAFAAAVPLLAVTLTSEPVLISLVTAAAYLPTLLLSIPAGALIDRRDRVRLMWSAQLAEASIVGVVAVLAAAGRASIGELAAMAFALGCCELVFVPASQAVVPDLVPAALLPQANGRQYTVTAIGQQFAGPPVGSLLFAVAVALPFGLDAVSFAVSAVVLMTLRRPASPATAQPGPAQPGPAQPGRRGMTEGLRWIFGHRLLRTLALLVGVNTFCYQLGTVTLVLLATRSLHLSAAGFGLLLAAAAIGSVLGGLLNARIVARIGALPGLLASLTVNVVVFLLIGLSPDALVLGTLLAVTGFVTTMWSVGSVTLRQRLVPPDLLGRVSSGYRLLATGLMPLGALAGGLVASQLGVRAAYPVAGTLRAIALLVALPVLLAEARSARPGQLGTFRRSSRAGRAQEPSRDPGDNGAAIHFARLRRAAPARRHPGPG